MTQYVLMNPQSEFLGTVINDLDESHGKKLKDIALTSIRSQLSGMRYRPRIRDPKLHDRAGVFVTLQNEGELRGCIGFVYPTYELWEATRKAAVHAAFLDARFKPISRDELETLEIEVSVIGTIEKIKVSSGKDIGNIRIGKDGLMVVGQGSSGLLLPQAASEMGFSPQEFLEETCEKAGLSTDAWSDPGVAVYRFPARIFT